jgi:hypothetical protein
MLVAGHLSIARPGVAQTGLWVADISGGGQRAKLILLDDGIRRWRADQPHPSSRPPWRYKYFCLRRHQSRVDQSGACGAGTRPYRSGSTFHLIQFAALQPMSLCPATCRGGNTVNEGQHPSLSYNPCVDCSGRCNGRRSKGHDDAQRGRARPRPGNDTRG